MKKPNRRVKAYLDQTGLLIFDVMQGGSRPKTVHRFAYGPKHQLWMRMDQMDTRHSLRSAEPAAMVKEEIARWIK